MTDLNESNTMVSKKESIKNRLQKYFLLISLSIIFLMSIFSLVFFYNSTLKESTSVIRNKLLLADLFMQDKKNDISDLAKNLASNRSVQLGIELESSIKLTEYLDSLEQKNNYRIAVFDVEGNQLTEINSSFSGERNILQKALSGESSLEPCFIEDYNVKSPAFVASCPVYYGDDIIGVVLVEFVFMENKDFFTELARNLDCELAIYSDNATVVSTGELIITEQLYKTVAYLGRTYEDISLRSSGLNEYKAITDSFENPIAVIRVHMSSYQYIKIFMTAIIIYIILATIFTVIVIALVLRVSASILNPIELLLNNVNIVRNGDLSHEVILHVQDEIGRLGYAFNELRSQLNEKITTIQSMNQSLEATVQERTARLNTLNDKMKHYLSPQLYASISGGERDVSVDKHYRKKLTVFFSDVVSFTATTESLEAEDLSTLLNSYLDNMAEIAQKYGGTIDKYVGDAVMVFFGDPEFTSDKDHAVRAVKMAMEMQERLISFREEWRSRGVENPFHVRMGINTGYCTIGNFGSETKMDYTIIGNNVNLAARFEAAAEPDSILMSPETYMLVKDEIDCVVGGEFSLKGVSGIIKAYTPVKIKKSKSNVNFAKVTNRGEVLFPEKPVDLKLLSPSERKQLILSVKNAFHDIVETSKDIADKKASKPKIVRKLDGDEGKTKKMPENKK
ncbi:MAG: HAMP domain-containing protein [Treponema sp.]|nr:HAMP domain-containing protein [Treponema sp.]